MRKLPALVWRVFALFAAALLVVLLPGALPARPDLVVIVVGAVALRHGPVTAALTGIAGGWLIDVIPPGGAPLGATALVMGAAGLAMGASRGWAKSSPVIPFLIVAAGAVGVQAVKGITAAAGFGLAHPTDVAWTVAMTAAFAIVLLPLLAQVERALDLRGWA